MRIPTLRHRLSLALALLVLMLPAVALAAGPRMFFLHHSTGRNMLDYGNARAYLAQVNAQKTTQLQLWDHDYNYIGLTDPAGNLLNRHFNIPGDNTYPDGLHYLFTEPNPAIQAIRDSVLQYDVIAFKSCFPASDIGTEAALQQYKDWYLDIRDVLDQYPDKTFLIMSQPPLHRLSTTPETADRARAFADWLGSAEFLSGHPNLRFFDFFDKLAVPDDGSDLRNTLRYEFEWSHTGDSHPNPLANETVAPMFIDAMVAAATPKQGVSAVSGVPTPLKLHGNTPNPFNPRTSIRFNLERDATVSVDVYDLRGRHVANLASGPRPAGDQSVSWDGRDDRGRPLGSGVYLYRVRAGSHAVNGRMVLSK